MSAAPAGAATLTVPGAPTIKSVKPSGDRAILVTIGKPASDGGSRISSYRAVCTSKNGGVTGAHVATSSPVRVPSLTAGRTYTCTAVANNSVGAGPASAPSLPVVARPTPPGPPTVTSVAAVGLRSIQVAFKKPTLTGGTAILVYRATCRSSDGGSTRTQQGKNSPIRVQGLTAADEYTCVVAAGNNVGLGVASAPSSPVVPRPVAPGAPTITSAKAVGRRSVAVAFTPPANDGGAAISSYFINCTSKNGGATRSRVAPPHSPIVVAGLTAGKTYTCTAAASNGVRRGEASAPSKPVVPRVN